MNFGQLWRMAVWQYSGFLSNFFLQIALTALLVPEYFGYIASVQATIEIFTSLTTFSFHGIIFRKHDFPLIPLLNHAVLLTVLQMLLLTTFLGITLYVLLYLGYLTPKTALIYAIFQLSTFCNNIKILLYTVLERQKTFVRNSQIDLVVNVSVAVLLVGWAWLAPSVQILVAKLVLPSVVLLLVYVVVAYKNGIRIHFKNIEIELLREIIQHSVRSYSARVVETFANRLDIFIGKYFFDSHDLGIYERVRYFAGLPYYLLIAVNNRILMVRYGTYRKQLALLQRTNFLGFFINNILFLGFFSALYIASLLLPHIEVLRYIFPVFLGFWQLGGLSSVLNNVKVYLFIKHHIFRTAIRLNLVPCLVFLSIAVLLKIFKYSPSIFEWSFIFASSQATALLLLSKKLYQIRWIKYTKYYWRWWKKRRQYQ